MKEVKTKIINLIPSSSGEVKINTGIIKLLSKQDLELLTKVLNSNAGRVLDRLITRINFAHSFMLEELARVPLNSKYGMWLKHFKTCEYSLSRELMYKVLLIYLKKDEYVY